jgi:hypothetical protein
MPIPSIPIPPAPEFNAKAVTKGKLMTLSKARGIWGKGNKSVSDAHLQALLDFAYAVAEGVYAGQYWR